MTVEIQTVPAYESDVAHATERTASGTEPEGRSPSLVEALARLEIATQLRDADAAARILAGLAGTEDGQWLLRQCVAAGLREVATAIAEGTTPGDELGQPTSVGVTVVTDPSTLRSVGPAA